MKSQENNSTVVKRGAAAGKSDNLIPFQTSTFQYDNQGNLLREERKVEGSRQESIYSYDGFNRQEKIINFENKVQVNHYDGEGLRHEMEENGKLVKFLYADREAVAEEKEDGNIIHFIRWYDLIASDSESARTYYHYASDEQGSITHVLGEDEDGEYSLKNYYEYGAFGDFREQYEEAENRFGYNGEIFDPIGGQYYLRARYYNPVIGTLTDAEKKELKRYERAKNNPLYQLERETGQNLGQLYNKLKQEGYTRNQDGSWSDKNGNPVLLDDLRTEVKSDSDSGSTLFDTFQSDEIVYVGRASGNPVQVMKGRISKGHDHFKSGYSYEIVATQTNKLANQGAEEFFILGYQEMGIQLENINPSLSYRSDRVGKTTNKIEALQDKGEVTGRGMGILGGNIDVELFDENILANFLKELRGLEFPQDTYYVIDGVRNKLV